jgi:hypothetical protein
MKKYIFRLKQSFFYIKDDPKSIKLAQFANIRFGYHSIDLESCELTIEQIKSLTICVFETINEIKLSSNHTF